MRLGGCEAIWIEGKTLVVAPKARSARIGLKAATECIAQTLPDRDFEALDDFQDMTERWEEPAGPWLEGATDEKH
jgi:hypothetical protein